MRRRACSGSTAAGGEPTVLTRPNRAAGEADHVWPEILPGGQAVLFTITATTGRLDQAQVAVLDLRTGTQTVLIRGGSDAHYVSSGHLLYAAEGTLRAVAFDLARLAVVGTSVAVLPEVWTTATGAANVAVAADGTLVYVPGGASNRGTEQPRMGGPPGPGDAVASRRRVRTSIRGSHRTAAASRSSSATRSWTSGCGICPAQRSRASRLTRGSRTTRSGHPMAVSFSSARSGRAGGISSRKPPTAPAPPRG